MSATRAVVLVSGGLDSAVTLAVAVRDGFEAHALSFDYGQRHRREVDAAAHVAKALRAHQHRVAHIDLRVFGASALTADIPVPLRRADAEIGHGYGIPVTYVPARNTIFLSYALANAEAIGAAAIFIGVNCIDYSDYPDCRPEFLEAFERIAVLGTKAGVEGTRIRIHAPLLELTKAEIIRKGVDLGVDFSITHSCYSPASDGSACGLCDSCRLRLRGFREAGITDPVRYQTSEAATSSI
jgi:7-cyano-7-deazaguanine synthase